MKVGLTERAQIEQDAIFDYLAERSPKGARLVIEAVERAFELISSHPEAGARTRRHDVRPHRDPLSVPRVYRIDPDQISVIHIRHASRRSWPGSRGETS